MKGTCVACVAVLSLWACRDRVETTKSAPKVTRQADKKATTAVSQEVAKAELSEVDYRSIADTMVGEQVRVKEKELVVITGGVDDVALLDELAVAVWKRGGHALVILQRPGLVGRYFEEVPEKYDAAAPAFDLKLAGLADVDITVGTGEPTAGMDVPAERGAALDKAFLKVEDLKDRRGVRRLSLGNGLKPTEAMAKLYGVPQAELARVFWAALGADAGVLRETGTKLKQAIGGAKELRLTNPNGTELTMRVDKRPVRVTDGTISEQAAAEGGSATIMWLPAGEVFFAPVPSTAEGTLVVDRLPYEDSEIRNFRATFEKGKMTSYSADPGAAFDRWKRRYEAAPEGKEVFSFVDVGINPGLSGKAAEQILNFVAAGMVTVGVGDNVWAGGENRVSYVSTWFLPGSTLSLDGAPLVENGQLKL